MKYLCLCHYDTKKFDALSPADLEALGRECEPHDEALHKSGHLVLVGSLALPEASVVVRPGEGDGDPSVSNGPYFPTQEPFGAFFIIEANDRDEAIRIASKHPSAHVGRLLGGGIEVRACDSFQQPPSCPA